MRGCLLNACYIMDGLVHRHRPPKGRRHLFCYLSSPFSIFLSIMSSADDFLQVSPRYLCSPSELHRCAEGPMTLATSSFVFLSSPPLTKLQSTSLVMQRPNKHPPLRVGGPSCFEHDRTVQTPHPHPQHAESRQNLSTPRQE